MCSQQIQERKGQGVGYGPTHALSNESKSGALHTLTDDAGFKLIGHTKLWNWKVDLGLDYICWSDSLHFSCLNLLSKKSTWFDVAMCLVSAMDLLYKSITLDRPLKFRYICYINQCFRPPISFQFCPSFSLFLPRLVPPFLLRCLFWLLFFPVLPLILQPNSIIFLCVFLLPTGYIVF